MKIGTVETAPHIAVHAAAEHGGLDTSAPQPAPTLGEPITRSAERAAPPQRASRAVSLPDFPHYELSFHLDEEHGRVVVEVIDAKTGTVVRTVPPEELRRVVEGLPNPRGILLDRKG